MWTFFVFFQIDFSLARCLLGRTSGRSGVTLPAEHLGVVVDRDVGSDAAVVGPKVAVWCPEPFMESMLQRQVLRPVAQVPAGRNRRQAIPGQILPYKQRL